VAHGARSIPRLAWSRSTGMVWALLKCVAHSSAVMPSLLRIRWFALHKIVPRHIQMANESCESHLASRQGGSRGQGVIDAGCG
jgi:hypothetical protein